MPVPFLQEALNVMSESTLYTKYLNLQQELSEDLRPLSELEISTLVHNGNIFTNDSKIYFKISRNSIDNANVIRIRNCTFSGVCIIGNLSGNSFYNFLKSDYFTKALNI
jgi:hypothetical protein